MCYNQQFLFFFLIHYREIALLKLQTSGKRWWVYVWDGGGEKEPALRRGWGNIDVVGACEGVHVCVCVGGRGGGLSVAVQEECDRGVVGWAGKPEEEARR